MTWIELQFISLSVKGNQFLSEMEGNLNISTVLLKFKIFQWKNKVFFISAYLTFSLYSQRLESLR